MHILYNTITGIICTSSNLPIQESQAGHAHAVVNNIGFDHDLVIYNAVTGEIENRVDLADILAQRERNDLRRRRNAKLLHCDWTQVSDVSLTPQQQQQWAVYRQALRDLPATWPTPLPQDYRPTWPQKP